ncbi:MAG TPA: serine hydrolase [Blastocatellia bacterium]|nr:serine hydrolase [Blastocatellia bacterium]
MKQKILLLVTLIGVVALSFGRLSLPASLAASVFAQNSADPAGRIQRVEAGLLPAVIIRGETTPWKLTERMAQLKVPGVSVAVINDGKIEWAKGYGVVEAGGTQPVTVETMFQAASISKPVATMAALRLVEEGRLSLDEDVNQRLKSWKVPDNEFTKEKKVTLRRLASHSAGLTVPGFPGYAVDKEIPTAVQILDGEKPANTAPVRVDIPVGSKWRYSGGGITVMQLLMTDVTGKSFPDLMRELVLSKIGMTHSTYQQPLPKEMTGKAAVAHRLDGTPVIGKWHVYPEMAAAGLWTTPSDLARFAIELQKSRVGKSNKVLSQKMTGEMLTRQFESWGLGIGLEGEGRAASFSHGGSNMGFRCQLVAFSETGQGAVVMTNSDRGGQLATEILRGIAVEYNWPGWKPEERVLAKVDPKIHEAYVGKYELGSGQFVTISKENDRLMAAAPGEPVAELRPESETKFFINSARVTFVKDEQGQVTEIIVSRGGQEMRARKVK